MRRFSVVSLGRSGSTMVQRMLDTHPEITCFGEIIRPNSEYGATPQADIGEFLERKYFAAIAHVAGFKMPLDWIIEYPDVFGAFKTGNYKIIYLTRQNKLDHFLSMKLAIANRNFNSQQTYATQSLPVDPMEAVHFIHASIGIDGALQRMCQRFETMTVVYEDLIQGRGQADMLRFLDVAPQALVSPTLRSRTLSRRETISNYDEVEAVFRGVGLGGYLDMAE